MTQDFSAALTAAQAGSFDVLVVGKIDRLGRSLAHLLRVLDSLTSHGVGSPKGAVEARRFVPTL